VRRTYVSACVGRTGLYFPADEPGYPDWFRRFAAEASVARAPTPALELEDVILCNGRDWACLYDRDGRRIDATALHRFDGDFAAHLWRAAPSLPSTRTWPTISTPVVYQSILFDHWGHFLLESIARLGPKLAHPEWAGLPSVYTWQYARRPPAVDAFFAALGQAPLAYPETAARIRLARCIVPPAAFGHEGFADPRHLIAPQRVARALLGRTPRDPRPVYLSRARVGTAIPGRGAVRNEAELQARLAARGFRIVHMEELSLAEQIAVINTHRVFVGLWGSALHNILFALHGEEVETFVLVEAAQRPANFLLVDGLVGNSAHYLNVLRGNAEGTLEIDVAAALDYLGKARAL
jgi:hypothetical protein